MGFGRLVLALCKREEQPEDNRGKVCLANGEKYVIEYKQSLRVRDVCIEIAKMLEIAPVALDFFTLMTTDCEHCLRPNRQLKQHCTKENDHYLNPKRLLHADECVNKIFFFRLAFKAIPGPDVKMVDKGAFRYFVMQCRWDYLNGRISGLTKKDHLTLLVLECIIRGHENNVTGKDILDNPKRYGLLHMFQDNEFSVREIRSHLKKQIPQFKRCQENVDKANNSFLCVLEGVADFGVTKIVVNKFYYNAKNEVDTVEWEILISANGLKKRRTYKDEGDFDIAERGQPGSSKDEIISDYKDIEYLEIKYSESAEIIHISRMQGFLEVISVGKSTVKKESLITLIEGFYHLLVNQYKTLTKYEPGLELPVLTLPRKDFEIHGPIERKKAEALLKAVDCANGDHSGVHMIRRSRQKFDSYNLSFIYGNEIRHYEIVASPAGQYGIVNGPQFDSLTELLQFYKTAQGGFPTVLKKYCPIPREGLCALFDEQIVVEAPNPPSTSRPTNPEYQFEQIGNMQLQKLQHTFTCGNFGERFFKARWLKADSSGQEVFCRGLALSRSPNFKDKVISSAEKMARLVHRNLVQFHGVCFFNDQNTYLAFEWISSGTLDDYLIKEADVTVETIITFAAQIAEACFFLHQNNYVHGWLAAHNVLVVSDEQVKVSDVSVPCLREEDLLLQSSEEVNRSPWKARECFLGRPYSKESDVWAFGVVLWEMFMKTKPFQNMTDEMIIQVFQQDRHLACPKWCPEEVGKIMKLCWITEPSRRPTFANIVMKLRSISSSLSDVEKQRKIPETIDEKFTIEPLMMTKGSQVLRMEEEMINTSSFLSDHHANSGETQDESLKEINHEPYVCSSSDPKLDLIPEKEPRETSSGVSCVADETPCASLSLNSNHDNSGGTIDESSNLDSQESSWSSFSDVESIPDKEKVWSPEEIEMKTRQRKYPRTLSTEEPQEPTYDRICETDFLLEASDHTSGASNRDERALPKVDEELPMENELVECKTANDEVIENEATADNPKKDEATADKPAEHNSVKDKPCEDEQNKHELTEDELTKDESGEKEPLFDQSCSYKAHEEICANYSSICVQDHNGFLAGQLGPGYTSEDHYYNGTSEKDSGESDQDTYDELPSYGCPDNRDKTQLGENPISTVESLDPFASDSETRFSQMFANLGLKESSDTEPTNVKKVDHSTSMVSSKRTDQRFGPRIQNPQSTGYVKSPSLQKAESVYYSKSLGQRKMSPSGPSTSSAANVTSSTVCSGGFLEFSKLDPFASSDAVETSGKSSSNNMQTSHVAGSPIVQPRKSSPPGQRLFDKTRNQQMISGTNYERASTPAKKYEQSPLPHSGFLSFHGRDPFSEILTGNESQSRNAFSPGLPTGEKSSEMNAAQVTTSSLSGKKSGAAGHVSPYKPVTVAMGTNDKSRFSSNVPSKSSHPSPVDAGYRKMLAKPSLPRNGYVPIPGGSAVLRQQAITTAPERDSNHRVPSPKAKGDQMFTLGLPNFSERDPFSEVPPLGKVNEDKNTKGDGTNVFGFIQAMKPQALNPQTVGFQHARLQSSRSPPAGFQGGSRQLPRPYRGNEGNTITGSKRTGYVTVSGNKDKERNLASTPNSGYVCGSIASTTSCSSYSTIANFSDRDIFSDIFQSSGKDQNKSTSPSCASDLLTSLLSTGLASGDNQTTVPQVKSQPDNQFNRRPDSKASTSNYARASNKKDVTQKLNYTQVFDENKDTGKLSRTPVLGSNKVKDVSKRARNDEVGKTTNYTEVRGGTVLDQVTGLKASSELNFENRDPFSEIKTTRIVEVENAPKLASIMVSDYVGTSTSQPPENLPSAPLTAERDEEPRDKEARDKVPGGKDPRDKEPRNKEPGNKEPMGVESGDKEPKGEASNKEPGNNKPEKKAPVLGESGHSESTQTNVSFEDRDPFAEISQSNFDVVSKDAGESDSVDGHSSCHLIENRDPNKDFCVGVTPNDEKNKNISDLIKASRREPFTGSNSRSWNSEVGEKPTSSKITASNLGNNRAMPTDEVPQRGNKPVENSPSDSAPRRDDNQPANNEKSSVGRKVSDIDSAYAKVTIINAGPNTYQKVVSGESMSNESVLGAVGGEEAPTEVEQEDDASPVVHEKEETVVDPFNISAAVESIQNLDPYRPETRPEKKKKGAGIREDFEESMKSHQIPYSQLTFNDQERDLGKGAFGVVRRAKLTRMVKHKARPTTDVAVKCLKEGASEIYKNSFKQEAINLMKLDNKFIVRFLGISYDDDGKLLLVTELVPQGSLDHYLRDSKNLRILGSEVLLQFAIQITVGMQYLESKKLVHRDLAARNILVASESHVKISDFGLSRIYDDEYYKSHRENQKLPIRWLAPECLEQKKFTVYSDVWSLGVTLWEMFSYGKRPYENLTIKCASELIEYLKKGNQLERPSGCPEDVYEHVKECWHLTPGRRISFFLLKTFLEDILRDKYSKKPYFM